MTMFLTEERTPENLSGPTLSGEVDTHPGNKLEKTDECQRNIKR
jgi:hypothetical protein